MKESPKPERTNKLSSKIEKIRENLLANATGDTPTYSVRVDLPASDGTAMADIMAGHTVYTRSSY